MNLASHLIPPPLDAKQALRLRRFGLAALSYALATALVALAWMFGELPARVALEVAAAFLALNLGLYLAIRSGFNLRFDDPSLTRFQILAAITVLMYIVYHMDEARNVALFGCFFVFLFGIFRLNAREFTVVALYALAAYALVIVLLMHLRPQAIHDVPREWMSWVMFAGWLPLFTVIGGQINTLRRKLRESELRFRSLTDMSSDFYWESDTEHRLTQRASANRKLSTVSVFRQGAQVGQRRWEIPYLSPDEAGWQAHRAVLDAHRPFRDFELSRLGLDGTERHISISGDPVFDKSGAFKGYRGVGKDITEQVRRIDDLRRLRAAMDVTIDSIYLTDLATMRFVEVNSAACRRLGYTREQLLEMGPQDVLVADREQLRRMYDEVIAAGERGTSVETHYVTSDGRRGWTELHRRALRSGSGWLIVTLGRDISERKRAEEAARESEVQLKGILESTTDGILAVDRKGKVIRANRRFAELWRIPKPLLDAGDDQALLDFVGSQLNDAGAFVNKVHALYASDAEDMDTLTFKDGRIFERLSFPLILDGAILGRVWSFRDITARKLAEEALRQNHARLLEAERDLLTAHESLAEADRLESVGRLAAGVAHEVKNPLTIIRLGIDHLSKQLSQESNQQVLDDIRGAIVRAEHVIKDLLDFSRQKMFSRRPTDVDQVIDKALHLIKHEIEHRNIAIVRNGNDPLPPIYADPDRLVQVFINLLSNAAQAIGQDGRIEVITRSLRLSERDLERSERGVFTIGEPVVAVDIRDNGPGFSAAHEKKLFEPFFTTKPVGEGSGLGLAVSRNIVIMHRGSISISNRAEGGVSALLMFRVAREPLSNEKTNTGSG